MLSDLPAEYLSEFCKAAMGAAAAGASQDVCQRGQATRRGALGGGAQRTGVVLRPRARRLRSAPADQVLDGIDLSCSPKRSRRCEALRDGSDAAGRGREQGRAAAVVPQSRVAAAGAMGGRHAVAGELRPSLLLRLHTEQGSGTATPRPRGQSTCSRRGYAARAASRARAALPSRRPPPRPPPRSLPRRLALPVPRQSTPPLPHPPARPSRLTSPAPNHSAVRLTLPTCATSPPSSTRRCARRVRHIHVASLAGFEPTGLGAQMRRETSEPSLALHPSLELNIVFLSRWPKVYLRDTMTYFTRHSESRRRGVLLHCSHFSHQATRLAAVASPSTMRLLILRGRQRRRRRRGTRPGPSVDNVGGGGGGGGGGDGGRHGPQTAGRPEALLEQSEGWLGTPALAEHWRVHAGLIGPRHGGVGATGGPRPAAVVGEVVLVAQRGPCACAACRAEREKKRTDNARERHFKISGFLTSHTSSTSIEQLQLRTPETLTRTIP